MLTKEQKSFLREVEQAVYKLKEAHKDLAKLWAEDHTHDIDLNEYISEDYPYDLSFDEIDMQNWSESANKNIFNAINTQ